MSDQLILYIGIAVFVLMLIGIGLTVYGFHQAGSEPVRSQRPKDGKRRVRGRRPDQ